MKVSFDFDFTLSRPDVQDYAKKLVSEGHDVWVTTARHKNSPWETIQLPDHNKDLFRVIKKVGIPKRKVIFCNMRTKAEIIKNLDFVWHLDDDNFELRELGNNTKIKAIDVKSPKWLGFCEKFLS